MTTTMKTLAMAMMMIMGTATATFANPGMKHNNKPVAAVVAHNHHHKHHHVRDHRHMDRPMHNCFCKYCKRMRHEMEMAGRRHEAEMRHMAAHRHHPEINARVGRTAYVGRH